jgi:iron complex outermembrane receptor protein/vitamin B12 transporter
MIFERSVTPSREVTMTVTGRRYSLTCGALAVALFFPGAAAAQEQGTATGTVSGTVGGTVAGTVAGVVLDALGARVPGAAVTLLGDQGLVGERTAGAEGAYEFTGLTPGRYQVVVAAAGFAPASSESEYVGAGGFVTFDVTVQIGPLLQAVLVTASAADLPQAQTGAPATVIDLAGIEALNKPDLLEALRLVPGSQVQQTGARGGTTSLFIRGGSANFAKVLIDGIVANDIGGGFDFSQFQTTGIEQVEVLRQANSVMYGSDALTGVVNITTRRGRTRVPEATYSIDGGNLGTVNNSASLGGTYQRLDYFSQYSYFSTDNDVPNNAYRNHTYAGRVGLALGGSTDLSATLRKIDGKGGSPNGFNYYGLSDDSTSAQQLTYAGISAQSQWTNRWQSTLRFGSTGRTVDFTNPTPTGEAFDPFGFGANYLGNEVKITGANGHSASGRAILDFGGTYPSVFMNRSTRRGLSGETTYMVGSDVHLSVGGRFEREQGYSDPDGDPTATRDNGGLFAEARGSIGGRTYVAVGVGYERNAAFRSATTPRLSVATYLRQPGRGAMGDTKLTFNVGNGIKAPAVFQAQSSLNALAQGVGSAVIPEPIGPERSRSLDVGVEQGFADGQARLRVSYFRNTFEDLIEFVSKNGLPQVGISPEAAQAATFGAYVNSSSFTAQGLEASAEAQTRGGLRLMASYTFLDAEVTESFASSALQPAINPSIPGVAIGAFSPLVGARPFRRPTHSGTLMASYTQGPGQITLSVYFTGKRDGSTFLSDASFGNSLLLPNSELEAGYQKVDLGGAYRVHPRLKLFVSSENLLDESYDASLGFPALPRTVRAGVTVLFGGDN